ASAEEGVDDVLEAHERATASARAPHASATGSQRVTAKVDDLPFAVVGEDFVRGVDLLEPLLRLRIRVDVRVVLPGQLAIGPLDIVGGGVAWHAENAVVVLGHSAMCPHQSVVAIEAV